MTDLPPETLSDVDSSLPLSPEQRASMASGAGVRLLRIDIDGTLDERALREAVERVCGAHEVLRHALCQVAGYRAPRQVVRPDAPHVDWRLVKATDGEEAWAAWRASVNAGFAAGHVRATLIHAGRSQAIFGLALDARLVDAASLGILFEQIAATMRGEAAAGDPFPYRQYVAWREELAETDDTDEADIAVAHWAALRRDAQDVDAPQLRIAGRFAVELARVRRDEVIDASTARRVLSFATERGLDAHLVLQAAWWMLMSRLNDGRPALGGWQHDCREDYAPMHGAIGLYEKTLPWLVDVAPRAAAEDWIEAFAQRARAHVDAQEFWPVDTPPFESHLRVGYAQLVVPPSRAVGAATWRWRELPAPDERFELALQVLWDGARPSLRLHADARRYDALALERLAQQYLALLDAVLAQPRIAVDAIGLLGERERAAQAAWQAPTMPVGSAMVGWHVARRAELSPRQTAIESREEVLDYAALEARVRRTAASLRACGVAPGDLVALNLPRGATLLVAMLAAWRLGAGYLPLDPAWPPARREAVLADARPRLALDAASFATLCDAGDGHDLPAPRGERHDLAYVLYTSGSTGRPKGVVIEQGALLNYVAAASDAMSLASCRRWGLTSAVAADLGNTALFGALFNGASLVIAQDDETRSPEAFARFVRGFDIDALKIVPSHLEALLETDAPALPATIVLGGEAAPRALVRRITEIAPAARVFNHYGPTETTVGVMIHAVSADDYDADVLPLTRVLANNRARVLDAAGRPVASGQLGALHVGGAQLCRGYLNRDDADAFVHDPLLPGKKLYPTGDLAVLLPAGGLRLAGRADHQVKIRGHRVEPAEIEVALLAQPGVRQAVVLAPERAEGARELVAVLVFDSATQAARAIADLRDRLREALPSAMQPARVVAVDEFPRLGNGKVDRLALAARLPALEASTSAARAPRDALEAWIAESMATLLGRPAVGVDEDFFELGGHSLLAIKLVARLRKRLPLELVPGLVFDHPSVAALGAALRDMGVDDRALAASA